ncbi:MAG: biotin/lipoyl-binding protein, partial [Bacteroidota bacterium]
MKKIATISLIVFTVVAASCGGGAKEKKGSLGDMKVELEKKKKDRTDLDAEIHKLEEQIAKADPLAAQQVQKLVSVDTLRIQDFTHFIELQGKVDANDIVYVTPRGMPAQVKELYVKRGDMVSKGQLLAKLDDAVMLQQVDGLKVQLGYAENIYNRQKNLWDQGIGTEVQLVTAKNNVDAIHKQIATLTESWKTSFVYAPISGMANEVNVKVGEIFNGGSATFPQIEIVNT